MSEQQTTTEREPEPVRKVHIVKTDIAWAGSGRDGDPWVMLSWDTERCDCDQPWRHAWLA